MENGEVPQMTLRFLAWAKEWMRCHSLRYTIHSMWRELTWFGAKVTSFHLYLLILRCFETFKKLHQLNIYMWFCWYSVTKSCLTLYNSMDYGASLTMGFPSQEYWSGLPSPSPGDLPDPRIEFTSPCYQSLYQWATWEALKHLYAWAQKKRSEWEM